MNKEQKEKEIAVLKDKLSRSKHLMVTDHSGINVADMTILRRKLRSADSEFRVAKNTFLRLAVKGTDFEELGKYFYGPTSLVFGYDEPAAPAKIVHETIKESEKPQVKSYFYEGQIHDFATLKRIAELPSRDQVLAGLISTVEAPISQFISLLESASREFVGTLEALIESRK